MKENDMKKVVKKILNVLFIILLIGMPIFSSIINFNKQRIDALQEHPIISIIIPGYALLLLLVSNEDQITEIFKESSKHKNYHVIRNKIKFIELILSIVLMILIISLC